MNYAVIVIFPLAIKKIKAKIDTSCIYDDHDFDLFRSIRITVWLLMTDFLMWNAMINSKLKLLVMIYQSWVKIAITNLCIIHWFIRILKCWILQHCMNGMVFIYWMRAIAETRTKQWNRKCASNNWLIWSIQKLLNTRELYLFSGNFCGHHFILTYSACNCHFYFYTCNCKWNIRFFSWVQNDSFFLHFF